MTSASLIVQDGKYVEGTILNVANSGNVVYAFNNQVSSLIVHNKTNDIISVQLVNPIDLSLSLPAYVDGGAAMTFGDYHLGWIPEVVITDTNTTGNGGGIIIVNGFFD